MQAARDEAQNPLPDDEEPMPGDANGEGVEVVEPDTDEFDLIFGAGDNFVDLDVLEEDALNAREKQLLTTFRNKLDNIILESCTCCLERDFGRHVVDGECARCRKDKAGPVKKYSDGNNMNPSKNLIHGTHVQCDWDLQ